MSTPSHSEKVTLARKQYDDSFRILEFLIGHGAPDYSDEWWGKFEVRMVSDRRTTQC
jgi:hypothetical protein